MCGEPLRRPVAQSQPHPSSIDNPANGGSPASPKIVANNAGARAGNPPASVRNEANDIEALKQRGFGFEREEKHADALDCFEKVLSRQPRDSEGIAHKALALIGLKRFDAALACVEMAIDVDRFNSFAWLVKSTCLSFLNRKTEADSCAGRAGAIAKASKAEELFNAKCQSEGLEKIEQALSDDATYDLAWLGKGLMLESLQRFEDALPCLQKAIELNPKLVSAWKSRAACLLRMRRFEETIDAAKHCLELNPNEFEIQMIRGVAEANLGLKEQALESLSKFLMAAPLEPTEPIQFARQRHEEVLASLRPQTPAPPPTPARAELDKAMSLVRRGLLQEAVAAFDDVIEIDPQCSVAWANMGQCLADLGRPEDGLVSLDRAVKLLPLNPGMWMLRAYCLAALDRYDDQLGCLNKAIELDSYQSPSWQNKGACLNLLGRRQEALICFERALVLNPFNFFALHNKGRTEQALGLRERASASFKRFLAIAPMVKGGDLDDQVESARASLRELDSQTKNTARSASLVLPSVPLQNIGDYEIYKELGRGGFGVVYLAVRQGVDEVYALKTFLPERSHDKASIDLFKKEAGIWLAFDAHPNLVRAYFVDEINGRLYIAMEFIIPGDDGLNTLDGYLRRKPPHLNQSLRWAIQFCHGIEHAYSKGIRCHRDIKPANIMIDWRKNLKISDFGLAGERVTSGVATRDGADMSEGAVGTPTHMPPEQWRGAANCDERSDIYAFGVTLYQMVSKGRLPFLPPLPRDNSAQEKERFMSNLYTMHATVAPPPLDSPVWTIIERCLRKNPSARYSSFRDLRGDLEPLLRGHAQNEAVPQPRIDGVDADTLVNKGLSMDSLNRMDDAFKLFDQALSRDPRHSGAWAAKAAALARIGRRDDALLMFDKAIECDPANDAAYNNKGNCHYSASEYELALECYGRAFELNPTNFRALRNRANTLAILKRFDEADACVNQSMKLDPHSAHGWSNAGETLRLMGRLKEAAACFKRAADLDPTMAIAWQLQGECLLSLAQHTPALSCFDRVIELEPLNQDAWTNKGSCLVGLGQLDPARVCFEKAIELNPATAAMAWNNKGDIFVRLKQFDQAAACFDRAIEVDPKLVLALCNKALRFRDLGQLDAALELLDRAVSIDPSHVMSWFFKGQCLKRKELHKPAIDAFSKVIHMEKQNGRAVGMALCGIGECWEKLGDKNAAMSHFEKALQYIPEFEDAKSGLKRCGGNQRPGPETECSPAKAKVMFEIAREHIKAHNLEEAVSAFTQAVRFDPQFVAAWCDLGKLLGAMKQYDQALKCLDRALSLDPKSHIIWLNKALCEDEAHRMAEALKAYKRFLEFTPPGLEKQITHAHARIAELAAKLGRKSFD